MSNSTPPIYVRDNNARMKWTGYFSFIILMCIATAVLMPIVLMENWSNISNVTSSSDFKEPDVVSGLLATMVAEVITLILVLWWTGNLRVWKEALYFKKTSKKNLLLGVGLGIAFFIGLTLITNILTSLGMSSENSDTVSSIEKLTGFNLYFVTIAGTAILAPFLEESLFRGYTLGFILRGNKWENLSLKNYRPWIAIIVASLAFALAHFQGASRGIDFLVLVWTFAFAISNSVLRIKTGSLWPGIFAHAVYNGISAVGILIAFH